MSAVAQDQSHQGIVLGQRYRNYEGSYRKPMDLGSICPHIFVSGIDIGQCGNVARRTGLIFEGQQAWLAEVKALSRSVEHTVTDFEVKGVMEGPETVEEAEEMMLRAGITEENLGPSFSRIMVAREMAEAAAFTPVWVPQGLVERIKELYERSVNDSTPAPERTRLTDQIRQIIKDSTLFS